jgi:hypothetical protein
MMKFMASERAKRPPYAPPFLKAGKLIIAQSALILHYLGPRLRLGGERQALDVILPGNPMALFHQVFIHAPGKRYRPAKAERAEPQEIREQLCERRILNSGGGRH